MSHLESTLIVNGRVVTSGEVIEADVLIKDGRIAGVTAPGEIGATGRVIDAAGCYVLPGVVDAHTHIMLNTGIYQTVDSWEDGTRAAAFGGTTTVIDFANQIVGKPFAEALEARRAEAADATIDYSFHMVILDADREEADLRAQLEQLMTLGIPSIKLFTTYRPNYYVDDATILRIFRAMPPGMIAMVHCENDSIVAEATRRLVERGETAWRYHGAARPAEAEAEAVRRVAYLAGLAQARTYIVHNSTAMATREVHAARQSWERIFCETCPQYLLLDESVYTGDHPEHFILQPPLRSRSHVEQLSEYVKMGWIDVLATDSCDYSLAQKQAQPEFDKTPGGLPGLELLLPSMFTRFGGAIGLPRLMRLLSENPARLFGLYPRKGAILPGSDADLVIYDPDARTTVSHRRLHHVAGYSPFEGMEVQGRVRSVLSRGEVIVEDGAFLGQRGRGRFLVAGPSRDLR